MPIAYQMDVTKSVIMAQAPSAINGYKSTARMVRYSATATCFDGTSINLVNGLNRPLYEVLDEALSALFKLLAAKDVTAVVSIKMNVGLAEGAKAALLNKYAAETEFATIKFT
ncbi:hypothetical protein [Sporosarcina sp. D27]|uniref:hypothetical protein n=1 Tax=Sporosarcina sp. D27 TaxID=1382305 RepID=UPI000472A08E|nr:hypothetical protein [Sporosarcina sp. D27]